MASNVFLSTYKKYATVQENALSLFENDQMQKFESTRIKIGFQYSRHLKELYVRDVFVLKFQTSVVTLKIQSKLRICGNKHCTLLALLKRSRLKIADYFKGTILSGFDFNIYGSWSKQP